MVMYIGRWNQWHVLALLHSWSRPQRRNEPRSRSSVALPLGINGEESGAAPGYRDFGRAGYEGVAGGIGNNGFCWSSATNGIRVLDLKIHSQLLSTSFSDYRGHGFPLRCLSE